MSLSISCNILRVLLWVNLWRHLWTFVYKFEPAGLERVQRDRGKFVWDVGVFQFWHRSSPCASSSPRSTGVRPRHSEGDVYRWPENIIFIFIYNLRKKWCFHIRVLSTVLQSLVIDPTFIFYFHTKSINMGFLKKGFPSLHVTFIHSSWKMKGWLTSILNKAIIGRLWKIRENNLYYPSFQILLHKISRLSKFNI